MARTKEPGVVYQLKITLRDSRPPVWRRVQVKDCSLAKLHEVIQTCMGWSNSHLHAFEVGGEQYGEPDQRLPGPHRLGPARAQVDEAGGRALQPHGPGH
jgi:hypothetical protein